MKDEIQKIISEECYVDFDISDYSHGGYVSGIDESVERIVSVVKERVEELFDDDDLYNGVRIKQMFLESLDGKCEIVIKSPAERRKQALSKLRGVNEDESREKM